MHHLRHCEVWYIAPKLSNCPVNECIFLLKYRGFCEIYPKIDRRQPRRGSRSLSYSGHVNFKGLFTVPRERIFLKMQLPPMNKPVTQQSGRTARMSDQFCSAAHLAQLRASRRHWHNLAHWDKQKPKLSPRQNIYRVAINFWNDHETCFWLFLHHTNH